MENETKNPWTSKTLWTWIIVAAAPLYPPVGQFVSTNPEAAGAIVAIVFAILRAMTETKLGLPNKGP